MDGELISVVVAAYNAENTIDRCVTSILAQSYTEFELIIVDDGSKDQTPKIADEWVLKDKRVSVIHKENGGLTSARKAGYDVSNGSFICFLDSDDYVEGNYLEELFSLMKNGTDIAMGSYYVENDGAHSVKQFDSAHIEKSDFTRKLILPSIYYIDTEDEFQYRDFVWLRLYRKSIIHDDCFVSERECYTEDLFFQFYALLRAQGVAITSKTIYHYVINGNSLTQIYRKNKLCMLENRYRMVQEFCRDQSVDISDYRLAGLQLTSMFGSVYNARLNRNYSIFRNECKKIYGAFPDCWKMNTSKTGTFVNVKQYLVFQLMKMRCYALLYLVMGI